MGEKNREENHHLNCGNSMSIVVRGGFFVHIERIIYNHIYICINIIINTYCIFIVIMIMIYSDMISGNSI